MDLLRTPADRGYPPEYLLSRIRGRRSRLVRDWKPFISGPPPFEGPSSGRRGSIAGATTAEGAWSELMREYGWVYAQMNAKTRNIFHPFFLYAELRTVFICLRRIEEGKRDSPDELLEKSLLSDACKEVLLSAELSTAVSGIERLFCSLSERFAGLSGMLEKDGLRPVEQHLTETFLEVTVSSRLHPLVERLFSRLIDARNIMALYKYLHLGLATAVPVVRGGGVSEARLRRLKETRDLPGVLSLVRELSRGGAERAESTHVERALYRGTTLWLKRMGRETSGAGPLLDYLWRCSLQAMNLRTLFHARGLERDVVAAELMQ